MADPTPAAPERPKHGNGPDKPHKPGTGEGEYPAHPDRAEPADEPQGEPPQPKK